MAFAMKGGCPFVALNIEIIMFMQQVRTYGAERIIMNSNLIKYISNIIDMVKLLLQKSNIDKLEYKIELLSTKILSLFKLERQYFCSLDRETIVECKIHSMIDHLNKYTKISPGYEDSWPQQLFGLFSSLSNSENVKIENIFEFHFDLVFFHRKLKKFVHESHQIVAHNTQLLTIYFLKLLIEELKLFLVRPMDIQKCSGECNTEFERVLDYFVCKYNHYGMRVTPENKLCSSSYVWPGFERFYKAHVQSFVLPSIDLPIKRPPEFFVQNQILSTTNCTGRPVITKVFPPIAKIPIPFSGIIPCQANIILPMVNNGLVIPAIHSHPPTPSLLLPMHMEENDLLYFLKNLKFDSYSKTTLDITIQKTQNTFEIIKSSVKKMLNPIFPHLQIYPYGSTYLGIVKSNQYYNFFVSLSECIYKPAPLTVKSLELLANTIKDMLVQDKDWTEINIILNRDFYLCGKYQLNDKVYRVLFSFNNGIEMCTSNLFQYFFELQPLCFEISHILKDWMDVLHLSDIFNGCVTTLLVIYYFQQLNYLPSVEVLQLRSSCTEKIENWQCSFERKSREDLGLTKVPHEHANKLLCDLFHFYGSIFSFNTHVIVPYVGHPIARTMFNLGNESQLPYSMRLYKENIQNTAVGDDINYFNNKTPICVQDPFCLINNVSWRIDLNSLNKFTLFCNISSNVYSTFTSGLISY